VGKTQNPDAFLSMVAEMAKATEPGG